jgi:glycosyltransferase involved in cell wall biosynthesis
VRIVHQVISADIAGGQLVALELARGAREAGHDVLVVTPASGPLVELVRGDEIDVRTVPLRRSFRLDDAVRYARVLRDTGTDVLHTHTHLAGNVLGRIAAQLARVPVVAHMHIENVFRSDAAGRRAQVALDNATARLCARILVVSEATRTALEEQGYPRERMEVVYNGVDLTSAESVRLVDGPAIVHVGRLAAVKGQLELIRALAQLDAGFAILVGRDLEQGGAYERALEREADGLGVRDRVVFAGHRDDVASVLAGADVVALPSHLEGLPLVLLEAMAQARPVVATRVGGTPEVVADGETGILVDAGDVDALADALRSVLGDPTRARTLGEAGRTRAVERFSRAAMVERVLGVYDEVVRGRRPRTMRS